MNFKITFLLFFSLSILSKTIVSAQIEVFESGYEKVQKGKFDPKHAIEHIPSLAPQRQLTSDSVQSMLLPAPGEVIVLYSAKNIKSNKCKLNTASFLTVDTVFYEERWQDDSSLTFKVWKSIKINKKRFYTLARIHETLAFISNHRRYNQLVILTANGGYDNYYDRGYPESFALASIQKKTLEFSHVFESYNYGDEFFEESQIITDDRGTKISIEIEGGEDSLNFTWGYFPCTIEFQKGPQKKIIYNQQKFQKEIEQFEQFLNRVNEHNVLLLDPTDTVKVHISYAWPHDIIDRGFKRTLYPFDLHAKFIIAEGIADVYDNGLLKFEMHLWQTPFLDSMRVYSEKIRRLLDDNWQKEDEGHGDSAYYHRYFDAAIEQKILNYHDSLGPQNIKIKNKYKDALKYLTNVYGEGKIGDRCSQKSGKIPSVNSQIHYLYKKKQYDLIRKVSRSAFPSARVWAMKYLIDLHEAGVHQLTAYDIYWAKQLGKSQAELEFCTDCVINVGPLQGEILWWDNKERYIKYFYPEGKDSLY